MKRLVVSVVATVTAVTAMVAPAALAQAATTSRPSVVQPLSSPTDCHNLGQVLCMWVSAPWVGAMGHLPVGQNWPHWYQFPESPCNTSSNPVTNHTWADCASSLDNASTQTAVVWAGDGLHGDHRCLPPGTGGQMSNLTLEQFEGHTPMNDAIESSSWVSSPSNSLC